MTTENHNRIFFPLRSNVEWFQNDSLKQSMLERFKHALLIYDEIWVENGTYQAEITSRGSYCPYYPAGSIPESERIITYDRDLAPNQVQVGITNEGSNIINSVIDAPSVARYKVDYFELLREVDLSSNDFIKYIHIDIDRFPKEAKTESSRQIRSDRTRLATIHQNENLRNLFIKNLNNDLLASILLNSAIALDYRHKSILEMKCLTSSDLTFQQHYGGVALKKLLGLRVPNLAQLNLKQIIALRNESTWVGFRIFLNGVLNDVLSDPKCLFNPIEIERKIEANINRRVFQELASRMVQGNDLAIELGIGATSLFIPVLSFPTAITSISRTIDQFLRDRSGWMAFLLSIDSTH